MKRLLAGGLLAALLATSAMAAEPDSCGTVRFSDVGWTDITATTAVATTILQALGYETKIDLLAVPVTYESLARGDIDVFLGNWMPTMEADIAPYRDGGHGRDRARQPRGREVHPRGVEEPLATRG